MCTIIFLLSLLHIAPALSLNNGQVPPDIRNMFCKNAVRGYTMIPWDCSGYLHCDQMSDLASWVTCPHGLLFDMDSITCKWYSSSCTVDAMRAVAQKWCPTRPDLTFPHPDSCAMFFNCSKRFPEPQYDLGQYEDECSYYQLYDVSMGTCSPNTLTSGSSCRTRPQGRCDFRRECRNHIQGTCTGVADGFYSDPDSVFSPAFIKCSSGTVSGKFSCNQPKYVFDPERRMCTLNYSGSIRQFCERNPTRKFPDPLQCAKFYDCSRIHHALGLDDYQAECNYMYLFDSSSLTCVRYNNLSTPCGSRFEPKAPCEYDVTDCSAKTFCLPCSASCKGLPDGDMPYPGLENTRFHLTCEKGRTVSIKECKIPMVFRLDTGRCRMPINLQPNIPLTTPALPITTESTTTTTLPTTTTTVTTTFITTQRTTTEASTTTTTTRPTTTTTSTTTSTTTTTTTIKPKTEPTPTPSQEVQQCACSEDLSIINGTMMNLASDLSTIQGRMQNMFLKPFDCTAPPAMLNAASHISYSSGVAIATYTCHSGYTVCKGNLEITCKGGNSWNTQGLGQCVKDSLSFQTFEPRIDLPCPLSSGKSISFVGRPVSERFNMTLMGWMVPFLEIIADPVSPTVQAIGLSTKTEFHLPQSGEGRMIWTIAVTDTNIQVYLNGLPVASVPWAPDDPPVDRLILGGFFVNHLHYPDSQDINKFGKHPLDGNLARGKDVTSRSSAPNSDSSRVVDGRNYVQWGDNSCWSSSTGDLAPWLQVDLGMTYYVSHVVLTSRDCSGVCTNHLHDLQIEVYEMDPKVHSKAKKHACFFYQGIFQAGSVQRLNCWGHVAGRYVRISATNSTGSDDVMTLCEMEVYGGILKNDDQRVYSCPDPPLIEGADVQVSYTQNEAKAKYTCHGSDVMCPGDDVITCSGGSGWDRSPSACLKTDLDISRGDDVSSIQMCNIPLGSSIELWLTPAANSSRVLELHTYDGDKFLLNVALDSTPGPVSLSHVVAGVPSPALYPSPRLLEEGRESHVVLTLLTHHLLIEVDGKLLFKYPVDDIALHNVNLVSTEAGLQVRRVKINRGMREDVYTDLKSTNLALDKTATASSSFGIPPSFSVDGNPEDQTGRGSCWHAQRGDSEPWLQVDLRKQFNIRELRLDIENKCTGCENVALKKPVTGVSIDGGPSTARIVDGILSSSPGFCHTSSTSAPSVVVDLGAVYNISSVALQRGAGTTPDSLSDVVINVQEVTLGPTTLCGTRTGALGEFDTVVCDNGPISGRYVSIERAPAVNKGPITLCEVEVHTVVEDRLHDFSVLVYRDNPDLHPGAELVLCTSHVGDLTPGQAGTLQCGEGVWGRYIRIRADSVLDTDDLMTVCEVEVYGDAVVKKEWSPFDCQSPPLRPNSAVSISYTENEAVATYSCNHGYSTCNGLNTLTCNISGQWSGKAEMCVKTAFSTNEAKGLGTVGLACSLKLGEAIELFIVPEENSTVSFLNFLTGETILEMNTKFRGEPDELLLASHSDQIITPRAVRVPDMTFTKGRESRVVVTFLSDHLDLSVDGKSVYAYPHYLLPDSINIVNSSSTFWKMSLLPAGAVDTKLSHMTDNLAESRSARASTRSGEAARAVDGITKTVVPGTLCWVAAPGDLDPWWMVELDSFYFVSHVEITSGNCAGTCGGRLHDFTIEVSYKDLQEGGRWDVCRQYEGVFPAGATETMACRKMTYGRFVRISSPGRRDPTDQLTLCEVKVFGGKVVRKDSGRFDCGTPPRVAHSTVEITTSSEGKMASYTCNHGYSFCGDVSPSRCVDGIWGDFSALCFKNVWHYTTMGESYSHNITCPVTLDSEIRVIATPTQNKRFSVELEFTPDKKVVFEASFTEPDINKASFSIQSGRRNIPYRGRLPFPFKVEQELQLTFKLGSKVVEVYVNGSKLGKLYGDMISHHPPSLITSQLATRRVSVHYSNDPNKVVKHTDKEQEWLRVPIEDTTYQLFEVKAAKNVYVDLRESETSKKGVTFIVGDRQNTRSICTNCPGGNMTSWHSPLSSWNFKKFWLSWDTPGKVSMGTGHTVGLETFIEDAPADFEKNFLLVGTLGTDGHWVFPTIGETSSESCPRPEQTFPLSIKSTQINDKKTTNEYECAENYVFCGESSVSVCDNDVASGHVMGGCELNRIPVGSGPETNLDLPCEFGEGSVISAYVTPTNDTGAVVIELVGSTGRSLQYRIDMGNRNQTVTSQPKDGTQSQLEDIVGFPFVTNQESHVAIGYSSGIYKIYVDGRLKHTYTPAVPHTEMSTVRILQDYSLKDLHLYPRNTPGDIPDCSKATLKSTVINAGDTSLGGQTTYQCAPDHRDCTNSHVITCGGDGQWLTSPDQICKQYIWKNIAMLRIPMTVSPPCPLSSGNAIKLVAQSIRGFWFDLRAGNEAQMLFQYEDNPTRLVLTTSILDSVLYEKSFNSSLISPNKEFTLLVQMHDTHYSVLIDGHPLYNYTYLTPVGRTDSIIITPGVTIKHLEIMADMNAGGPA